MAKWQPIETAPKDGTIILGADKDYWRCPVLFGDKGRWLLAYFKGDNYIVNPSNWMPLQDPPKEKQWTI